MPTVVPTQGKGPESHSSGLFPSSSDDDKKAPSAEIVPDPDLPLLGAPADEKRFWWQRTKGYNGSAIATQPSVYDNPETAKYYMPRPDWENLHRFDPLARWTWDEENALIKKIDVRIMILVCVMFMALELDRANIGQAVSDNFLDDLGLTTNDYNLGNTVFKLSFLCAELPSQLGLLTLVVVYLYVKDITVINKWVTWGVLTALIAHPSPHPIQVGWNSRNSNSVRTRTVSAAIYNMTAQAGGIIASNIYRQDDAPRYKRGNRNLVCVACLNIGLYLFAKVYYVLRNRSRAKKWDSMSNEQKLDYLRNTTDEGNKRLDFRFAH
ncbi:related to nicotinamide mononucleotide permease [Cephalotrichum gorgonifer]|uniref:Related to nicotinamide mononucleotide permease n=1 Tax=Cephalotrichum gorgonifer TaxID=2041049 RepID=A0AAE8MWG2_9PEZI|nr:related to nicotinamide mononucleotide permease [Cephalotrichum gorgonifer]